MPQGTPTQHNNKGKKVRKNRIDNYQETKSIPSSLEITRILRKHLIHCNWLQKGTHKRRRWAHTLKNLERLSRSYSYGFSWGLMSSFPLEKSWEKESFTQKLLKLKFGALHSHRHFEGPVGIWSSDLMFL
jgi:hypothetical protein